MVSVVLANEVLENSIGAAKTKTSVYVALAITPTASSCQSKSAQERKQQLGSNARQKMRAACIAHPVLKCVGCVDSRADVYVGWLGPDFSPTATRSAAGGSC